MDDSYFDAVDVKRLSLIDVSFEDDRLIEASPPRPVDLQSSGVTLGNEADYQSLELLRGLDAEKVDEEGETMPSEKPIESSEERASKTPENYHLRKSLAWDTAFFTNDGVLEPDELSSMIEDAGKKAKRTLPMILEETQRSTESISTLASDTLTLASLEAELFEDIRASIQKSNKTTNVRSSDIRAGQSLSKAHAQHSSKETDIASRVKVNGKPASKKSSLGMIPQGKTSNHIPAHRRVSQSVAVGEDSHLNSFSSKPPKPGTPRPTPSSTKRESMGANLMKTEKNNTGGAIGRCPPTPKVPVSGVTRSIVPRPSSSKSPSTHSASVKTQKMTPPSDSSPTSSSGKVGKYPASLRIKSVDPGSRKLSSAGASTLKTPTRSTHSRLSAQSMSGAKPSSISPASSWSSESSSSTSTVQQGSNGSRASLIRSSCEKNGGDGDTKQQPDEAKTRAPTSSTRRVKSASTGGMQLPNSQPSGLRRPSPKIGYFDGVRFPPGTDAH